MLPLNSHRLTVYSAGGAAASRAVQFSSVLAFLLIKMIKEKYQK